MMKEFLQKTTCNSDEDCAQKCCFDLAEAAEMTCDYLYTRQTAGAAVATGEDAVKPVRETKAPGRPSFLDSHKSYLNQECRKAIHPYCELPADAKDKAEKPVSCASVQCTGLSGCKEKCCMNS